ncbi:MAG TPA: TIGR02466 family protein [Steroidobacteraceae bacterium]|nr:TIGR02466 family protein [Steroidobacteraceae bacterium]
MPVVSLFPTRVYAGRLQPRGVDAFNARLLRECAQYRADDVAGRAWSRDRYPGGYTSYGSLNRMHTLSPTFARLERALRRHVLAYARALEFDLEGRDLSMTDCWINMMPRGVTHGLHLHPLSTISGTYYVRTPRGVPGLKVEDPRLDRYMAAPPRRADAAQQTWVTLPVAAGTVLLFESWLRHEVPPNPVAAERVSVSFNFNWF